MYLTLFVTLTLTLTPGELLAIFLRWRTVTGSNSSYMGRLENAGRENGGPSAKSRGVKDTGPENDGPNSRA